MLPQLKITAAAIFILLTFWTNAQAANVKVVKLKTADIAYDPFTQKIYASVPSAAGAIGNTVTVLDPATGMVGTSVFVGSEPRKLALSDDGQFLYVALDGAAAVRRFNVPTLTAGLQFSLGSNPSSGPYFVEDMAVQPGNPFVLAIARKNISSDPGHEGVAVYENGVQRPNATPRHTGSNVIEFSSSPQRLYGYSTVGDGGFRRMNIDDQGVVVVDTTPNLGLGDIIFDSGFIFSLSGRVVDPETLTLLGSLEPPGFGLILPNVGAGRIYLLWGHTLLTYNWPSFALMKSEVIPGIVGTPASLIRWGNDGIAFRTSSDQVFLVRTTHSGSTADLTLTMTGPSSAAVGSQVIYDVTVTNKGPTQATDVILNKLLNVGDIAPGSSAEIAVIVTPSLPGEVVNSVAVNANELDPNPVNNLAMTSTNGSGDLTAPDLTGSWISMTQTCTRVPVCTLRGVFDVTNRGSIEAPQSLVRFFASRDGYLAITDSVFSQAIVDGLGPNQTQRVSFSVKLPRGATAHGLHLIAFVDAVDSVAETDEGNNVMTFGPIQ